MIRTTFLVVVLLIAGSFAARATDVNGTWAADVTSPRGRLTLTFDFHVDGAALTGKITRPRGDGDISEGTIDFDNISFTQVLNSNGNVMKIVNTGKADVDGIKFTSTLGDRLAVNFAATRPQ